MEVTGLLLVRGTTAALVWLALVSAAGAETLTATIINWGLLGSWAIDCSLLPDRDKGAVLTYEVRPDGRVMYRRNFGDARDENEVVAASTDADGLLNIMVFFPALHQTREFGLALQTDGSLRAIFNRGERGDYTIRDGKFVRTGAPTPAQHRCGNST
ncbi:hypothetical protein GCM10007857_31590 [Bradyrhizobium iriomotense]|uniref:Uncharacterized protein n=1 Tax=Bradyrhizobium iriomotense TaxID=441950 RepID=A0ABQ6AY36_9BRAD|nr:hypothetical protein GCM10007857_31590 [Bradyrhizobium iriomotense]